MRSFSPSCWASFEGAADWRIEEDPEQWRGGLHITTPASYVDASMEQALAQVCETLLLAAEQAAAPGSDNNDSA